MRHFITHIAIALITFMAGTASTTLFSATHNAPKLNRGNVEATQSAEETDIVGVVFRHQIEHSYHYEQNTYYLSCYNYSDPSEKVITYLTSNGLHAKALSQVQYDSYTSYDAVRIFLRLGSVKWISDTEVIVGTSSRSSDWRINYVTRAYIYRLVREDQGWKIISTETIG